MGAALFGFRPAQAIPCPFHRLGLLLDFPQPALNTAQLFRAQNSSSAITPSILLIAPPLLLLLLEYILFLEAQEI